MRPLRLRMSDETVRVVMVDENQPVANLMVLICTKLGITNHDEYSLIATGKHTINGRRKERQDGRIIDAKMEQLKKKLKTDEDLAWVDHSKTLDEQEIHEQDVVLLRRRFFYSDQNVDSRDPVQLGLLYVQTRDAILSGTHPVTLDGACKFAGLQAQAQLGDFVEGKTTRPGYIGLKDYLPADYAKTKHIERKIFAEHKKYYGLSELEAKAKYVGESRSLPTYGVTFFLVKEKVAGKNKLVPRLLGITKDCVMRVDADTKGILKTWPLTTVKRWAASLNSFTLDFGDYSDSYYSVQTSEGEQISQLIAGYIDIILKRRKAKDHFGIEGDEGATMIEDSVAPSRATIIQNQPALTRPPSATPSQLDLASTPGPQVFKRLHEEEPILEPSLYRPAFEVKGKAEIGFESRPRTEYLTNYELSLPQRDLQDRLEQAQDAVEQAQKVLDKPAVQHQHQTSHLDQSAGSRVEVEQKRRRLSNQFAEINAATAQLVSLSAIPEDELNYPALNQAVETVASSLPTVARDVKTVASLMEDEEGGERLIDAARRLCKAFSDLLNAAEPGPTVPRQSLISAASRVGDATQALLYTINNWTDDTDGDELDGGDLLLSLAKSVASSAAQLVVKTKDVARACRDPELEQLTTAAATQCALAISQMVVTAKIVAPTIHDPKCQRKLFESCDEVRRSVAGMEEACRRACRDEAILRQVDEVADRTNAALDELVERVRSMKRNPNARRTNTNQSNTTTRTTTTTTTTSSTLNNRQGEQQHRVFDEASGRTVLGRLESEAPEQPRNNELVDQARQLARATTQLIQDIRPSERVRDQSSYGADSQQANRQSTSTSVYEHHERRPLSMYDSESTIPIVGGEHAPSSYSQIQHNTNSSSNNNNNTISSTSNNESSLQKTTVTTTTVTNTINNTNTSLESEQPVPEAAISGIIGDLDTTIMFATAGTLRAQADQDSYLFHRENVLRCAKALVEDTRPLVASAASDQQQLARAAHESVVTMSRLADTVKASAASLGPNQAESQVSLIRSVKDVAVSLADLIGSTKSALGADSNDPRLLEVKDSAKMMVSSVTSLLRTVKNVEDEQQRGVRAIEAALETIEQELVNYASQCVHEEAGPSGAPRQTRASAEDIVRVSRPATMATAKTVQAASSGLQDDAILAAKMGEKATVDLLHTVRSASFNSESFDIRARVQEAGRSCALSYKHLLELLHRIFQYPAVASANPEVKQELINQSKMIASCIQELVNCSQMLKATSALGNSQDQQQHYGQGLSTNNNASSTTTTTITSNTTNLGATSGDQMATSSGGGGLDWGQDFASNGRLPQQQQQQQQQRELSDATLIAENELLGAASSIDAAARKLENLKPRVSSVKLPHEELNFDEIILDAAKSIIEATAALLRAASASQRELIVDGRLDETETFYASDNNQWSEGLVSAARMVAAATHSLVEAANALVQGQASEERLISAAKQVASSTNQLLVACKVKADPDSRTMSRLANAGQQVKRATDNLVRAAQQAIENDEEQSLVISNRKVSGIAQEISAREQILKKEKELQVAKTQLMAIRKAKYANRPDDYQGYGGSLD